MSNEFISNHTLLMNFLIGFSNKHFKEYSKSFSDLGFSLEYIEAKYKNSEDNSVNPDIVLSSNKLIHTILFDCKSNTVEEEQLVRYSKLTKENIVDKTSVYDSKQLTYNICFCTNTANDSVIEDINNIKAWPILRISKDWDEIKKENDFSKIQLNKFFDKPIKLDCLPPTSFFPFSDSDTNGYIAGVIFQHIFAESERSKKINLDPDKIAQEVNPFWKNINRKKQKLLIQKITSIIYHFKNKGLDEKLKKILSSKKNPTKSLEALQRECENLIDTLDKQTVLGTTKKAKSSK